MCVSVGGIESKKPFFLLSPHDSLRCLSFPQKVHSSNRFKCWVCDDSRVEQLRRRIPGYEPNSRSVLTSPITNLKQVRCRTLVSFGFVEPLVRFSSCPFFLLELRTRLYIRLWHFSRRWNSSTVAQGGALASVLEPTIPQHYAEVTPSTDHTPPAVPTHPHTHRPRSHVLSQTPKVAAANEVDPAPHTSSRRHGTTTAAARGGLPPKRKPKRVASRLPARSSSSSASGEEEEEEEEEDSEDVGSFGDGGSGGSGGEAAGQERGSSSAFSLPRGGATAQGSFLFAAAPPPEGPGRGATLLPRCGDDSDGGNSGTGGAFRYRSRKSSVQRQRRMRRRRRQVQGQWEDSSASGGLSTDSDDNDSSDGGHHPGSGGGGGGRSRGGCGEAGGASSQEPADAFRWDQPRRSSYGGGGGRHRPTYSIEDLSRGMEEVSIQVCMQGETGLHRTRLKHD